MTKAMRLSIILLCILGLAMTSSAAIFEDNFDSESLGLNYTGFANWNVSNRPGVLVGTGTVDLIGNPGFFDLQPGNGRYVDLDGSTANAGMMTTKQTFNFIGGQSYALSMDLAGNLRDSDPPYDSVNVKIGNDISAAWGAIPWNAQFDEYLITFIPGISFSGAISIWCDSGDDFGALLDNVKLDYNGAAVPEPATLLLLGAGLIGLVGYGRKRLN